MQKHQINEPFLYTLGSTRVEVVPDDDMEGVLAALGQDEVLMDRMGYRMYVRMATWKRIMKNFPAGATGVGLGGVFQREQNPSICVKVGHEGNR